MNNIKQIPFNFKKIFSISNDCDLESINNYSKLKDIFLKNGLHISSSFWIGNINQSNKDRKVLFNKKEKNSVFDRLIKDYHDGFLDHFHNYNEDNVNIIEYLNKGVDISMDLNSKLIRKITGNNLDDIMSNKTLYLNKIKENIDYYELENLTILFFSENKITNLDVILSKQNEKKKIEVKCFYINDVKNILNFNSPHFNSIKKNYNFYYRIKYFDIDIKLNELDSIEFVNNNILIEKIILSDFSYKIIENQLSILKNYNITSNFIPKHGGNLEYYLRKRGFLKKNLFLNDICKILKENLAVKCCWSDDLPSFPFLNKNQLEIFKNKRDSTYLDLNNIKIRETVDGYYISRNSFYPLCRDPKFADIYYTFKKGNLSINKYNEGLLYLSKKFKINLNYLKSIIPYNKDKMSFSQGNMMPFYIEYTFITNNIEYFWYTHFGTYNFDNINVLSNQLKKLSKKYYIDNEIIVMSTSCFVNYKIMMYNINKLLNRKASKWIDLKTDFIDFKNNIWNINIKYLNKYNCSSLLNYLTLNCLSTWSVKLIINGKQYSNFYRDHKNKTITIIDNSKGISLLGNIKKNDIISIKDCVITNTRTHAIINSKNTFSYVKLRVNNIKIYNLSCLRLNLKKSRTNIKNISIKIHSTNGVLEILNNVGEDLFEPTENNYIFFEFYTFGNNDIYLPVHNILFNETPSFLYGEILSIEFKIETFNLNDKIEIYNLDLFSNAGNINNESVIFEGKVINNMSENYNLLIKNKTTNKITKVNDKTFFLHMKYGDDISILTNIYNCEIEIDRFTIKKNTFNYKIVLDENIFNNSFLDEVNFISVNNYDLKDITIEKAINMALNTNYPVETNFYKDLIEIKTVKPKKYNFSKIDFLNKLFLILTNGCNDDISKIKKICNYLNKRIYHNFAGNTICYEHRSMVTCPVWIILHRMGKCGQVNRTLYDILNIQGYKVRIVQLKGHVACEVYINGKWWLLDVDILIENEFYCENSDLISALQIYKDQKKYSKLFIEKFKNNNDEIYELVHEDRSSFEFNDVNPNYNKNFIITNINNINEINIINSNLLPYLKKNLFTIEQLNNYLKKYKTREIYIVSNFKILKKLDIILKKFKMSHFTIINDKIVCVNFYWYAHINGRNLRNVMNNIFKEKPYYYEKKNKNSLEWDNNYTTYY